MFSDAGTAIGSRICLLHFGLVKGSGDAPFPPTPHARAHPKKKKKKPLGMRYMQSLLEIPRCLGTRYFFVFVFGVT